MSYQVDGVIGDLDAAMRMLRRAIRGVPAEQQGFKGAHDRLTKAVAEFALVLEDCAPAVRDR